MKAKLTEFPAQSEITCGRFGVREQVMTSAFWVCVGTSVLLAWSWWKPRRMKARKAELEGRIEDLLTISDGLNYTHGRRARSIAHTGFGRRTSNALRVLDLANGRWWKAAV